LAGKFLADYPASWLLAQVYEIAAKACIDLNDGECALRMGEQSLRLLPENPLLLVPLTNVQIQRGLFAQALDSASAALNLLDRFAAPAGMQPGHWSKLKRELRTSSYYARGRVYATQGLDAAGKNRGTLLEQALGALREAAALSPEDPEPIYLRGLVLLALGRREDAIADFRFAAVRNSPVQGRAQDQLKKLNSREETVESRNPPAPSPPQAQRPATGYAGSEQCKTCHPKEFEAWRQTAWQRCCGPTGPRM
jgi:tetratricopeptide (TPR) repeat protein